MENRQILLFNYHQICIISVCSCGLLDDIDNDCFKIHRLINTYQIFIRLDMHILSYHDLCETELL